MTGVLTIIFVGAFLLLAGRFLYIQASGEIDNVSLKEWAKQKRTSSYKLDAERGKIYDHNGVTLAYDRPTYRLYAILDEAYSENQKEPKHVTNPEKTAEMLAPLLDVDEKEVLSKLNQGMKEDKFQVEFGKAGKDLSQQEKEDIEALNLPGLNFKEETIRYYPNGMFASQIIGFARKEENGTINGVTGIENKMNKRLTGKDGHISYERDKYNKKLLDPNEIIQMPENGEDIYLTIDQKIQTLLEDVLTQVNDQYKAERVTAIVMDAKTGEIVAMSNRPSYNPNNPQDVKNWYNDAISTPFEPGSTIKMFTWAAAIEEGVYNGDEGYQSGSYRVNERIIPIDDHNGGEGWGTISYDEGFERSSNVAAAKLVWEKIGAEKYLDYLKAFDFDKESGIDLPGEVAGQILYNWPREKLTTAFGQGSTLTPIQQMKAATAIANDGKMLEPYVIKKIVNSDTGEVIKEHKPKVVGQPISKETSDQVLDLLESVVQSKNGTGKVYRLDDYSVAGKTGTAQIPNPNGPGYLTGPENYIFSFLGMAPKDDPRLIMYVSVKQPKLLTEDGYEQGSAPVSFIFNNVMENGLHYLNIEPDKETTPAKQAIEIPEIIGTKIADTKNVLKQKEMDVTVIGKGKTVVAANVAQGEKLLPNSHIILVTDQPTMPDLTNWSTRDVMQLAELLKLKIETTGNGYAVSQSIKKGKKIKNNDQLHVEFKAPNEKDKKQNKKE